MANSTDQHLSPASEPARPSNPSQAVSLDGGKAYPTIEALNPDSPLRPGELASVERDVAIVRGARDEELTLHPEEEASVEHDLAVIREDIWGEPMNREQRGDSALAEERSIVAAQQTQTSEAIEKTTREGSPLRYETSKLTAEYEPGTGSVDFTEKASSTKKELVTAEGLEGSADTAQGVKARTEEVLGAKIDRDEFDNGDQPMEIADRKAEREDENFSREKRLASYELKTDAVVTVPNKEDGIYYGRVLGVTDQYLIQRSGPSSAVAHEKRIFDTLPSYGREVSIQYGASNPRVSLLPNKQKELGIER
jgi:hypothetical protein